MADYKFIAFVFVIMAFGLDSLGIANSYSAANSQVGSVSGCGCACVSICLVFFVYLSVFLSVWTV